MRPSVFIVDDDDAVRDAISLWLSCHHYDTHCFADAAHFIKHLTGDAQGCIIADIRMPGMDGLELQAQLNLMHCQLPLIFITGHGTVPMAVEAMRNGAQDYLRKPVNEQQLLVKVEQAFAIDQVNSQRRCLALQRQTRLTRLTHREQQVAARVVEGLPNKAIASELGISDRTVEVHRANVMLKLEVKTLAQLVKNYLDIGH
tara:strand:- start:2483 stop:3085 length:603 start_codon:yes stop_codon:yes gene_type:complete